MSKGLLLHVKRVASACQKEGFEIEKVMGEGRQRLTKEARLSSQPGLKRGFHLFNLQMNHALVEPNICLKDVKLGVVIRSFTSEIL